jgi:ribosomal protein S18 acetylase RimI-like enzyme
MVIIEKATLTDKSDLIDLLHQQFNEHDIQCSADVLEVAVTEMLKREDLGMFLVSRDGDQVIGFAAISFAWTLEHGGKSAWLDELYVLPGRRGAGVGAMMIDSILVAAEKAGCLAIDLEVEEEHQRAEHLYRRKGFERLRRNRWAKSLASAQNI